MGLPTRLREPIKTGLAMSATLGIAMWMEFLEPVWAGFAVAFISLETRGQSLNKALLRLLGTLLAFAVSLTLMSLLAQARWGMLLALTPYIGLCVYMLAGNKRPYFWFVGAFVTLTIMIHAGADSLSMFRFAVARLEETALGVGVYGLVSTFLWPQTSRAPLEGASRQLLETHVALFRAYRELLGGRGRLEDSRPLRLRADQELRQLGVLQAAAETDTYEVWELRHAWRRFLGQSQVLLEALARWRTCVPEVRPLDLPRLLPGLEAWLDGIDRRLERIGQRLGGGEGAPAPEVPAPELERMELDRLGHFEKAALAEFVTQVRTLDTGTRELFDAVRDIRGSGRIVSQPLSETRVPFAIDPDRFRAMSSVLTTLWASYALWVWVDPPGDAFFWFTTTQFALLSALSHTPIPKLLPGLTLGLLAGGVAYVLVMPHLSGYGELGLLIFLTTAGGCALFSHPRQAGTKGCFVAFFLISISIDNQQSYSFVSFANTAASSFLALALAAALAYLLGSPRPEKVFLRLLARYFRIAEDRMSQLAPQSERRARWRRTRRGELFEVVRKLAELVDRIDCRLLPGTTPDQIRSLVTNLTSLTWRIEELLDAREHVDPDPRLEELVGELREWRRLGQRQFRLWASDPSAAIDPGADMSDRLHARLARIEDALEAARSRAGEAGLPLDYEALYRYLGGFRGLSEAAIGYAGVSESVAWEPWREARF